MGKIRKKYDTEFKKQLVQKIESGELSHGQAMREYGLSSSTIWTWMTKIRAGTLIDKPSFKEKDLERENRELKEKLAELYMQVEHLKKFNSYVQQLKSVNTSVITERNLDQFQRDVK